MRPGFRLAGLAVLVAAALTIPVPAAQARTVEGRLGDGLRAAACVAVVRVLDVERSEMGERAEVRVLAVLKGDLGKPRVWISSPPEASPRRLREDPYFREGSRLLVLLAPPPGPPRVLLAPPARATLALGEDEPRLEEIREAIGGYLEAIARSDAEPAAVKEFLMEWARGDDGLLRQRLLRDLGHLLTEQDLPFLASLHADPTQPLHTRRWAVRRVSALQPEAVPPTLAALLSVDEPAALRKEAVQVYAARGGPESLPALAHALEDPDPDVRVAAILGLHSSDAVSLLRERFGDEPSRPVRLMIVRQLAAIDTIDSRQALEAIVDRSSDPEITDAVAEIRSLQRAH